eukprot:CAMPEP_0184870354 /NCGR_PEP_ID=MMETSP0580-20130426/37192_1 /TAXON_ID=1118495 /ORGANISM="Dactyliosolen fragilissimus" /LENGTH=566 /DNA_ID=CAMNT_0027372391 /DNA_START=255 /DNA_END=1955 /DNA_ORIENTATION=+
MPQVDVEEIIETKKKRNAIIIGGGPVGLAAALTLAKAPHSFDVTVYEATPDDSPSSTRIFDPTKAYSYLINARGQKFTSGGKHNRYFPEIQTFIESMGVPLGGAFAVVPWDPKKAIPKSSNTIMPFSDKRKKINPYWIPRHSLINIMHDVIEMYNSNKTLAGNDMGTIEYFSGIKCVDVKASEEHTSEVNSSSVLVTLQNTVNGTESLESCQLLVGADGIDSKVRDCLSRGNEAFQSWPRFKGNKFNVKKWVSPSTGLRIKALQFPPGFQIKDSDGSMFITEGEAAYAMRPKNTSPLKYLSLGLLPTTVKDSPRPGLIITRPKNDFWKITDGEEMRQYFQKQFPRMDFRKGEGIISDQEWERFAVAQGTRFPHCQYSPGLQASSGNDDEDSSTIDNSKECGIVLVGDAVHSFPPDIGQGINAGLTDVVALDHALRGENVLTGQQMKKYSKIPRLSTALKNYEREREPETRSLIRLARFGAPYQYGQSLRFDRLRTKLWFMNVILRTVLNKLTFGLIPKAAFFSASNPDMSYRKVMRRADSTTALLSLPLLFYAITWMVKKFKFVTI